MRQLPKSWPTTHENMCGTGYREGAHCQMFAEAESVILSDE